MERDRAIECGRIVISKARDDDVVRVFLNSRCDTLKYMTMRDTTKERPPEEYSVSNVYTTAEERESVHVSSWQKVVTHIEPR